MRKISYAAPALLTAALAALLSGCSGAKSPAGTTPANNTTPAATRDATGCPLSQPGSTIGMTLPPSCRLVASDTASSPSIGFWNRRNEDLDCDLHNTSPDLSGVRWPWPLRGGDIGDPQVTALGSAQPPPDSYRQITVVDGANAYRERCELGFNWTQRRNAGRGHGPGPTVFYREGERRVTYISFRLGPGVDPSGSDWRTVMQMKQTQPYDNQTLSPVIEMEVHDRHWVLVNSWRDLWAAPAQKDTWTRFAFDVTYSQDPSVGRIKVYVDLNGDGDFGDADEVSPTFDVATLRAEAARVPGGTYSDFPSPWAPGQSIPSHLRAGIYQNPDYSCPSGCSVDVDNVQVVKP